MKWILDNINQNWIKINTSVRQNLDGRDLWHTLQKSESVRNLWCPNLYFLPCKTEILIVSIYLVNYCGRFLLFCTNLFLYLSCWLRRKMTVILTHSERRPPKYLFPRGNKPLLYHQIGNRNFFIFITNQKNLMCRQNKIWTFGNPFQSKKLPICTYNSDLQSLYMLAIWGFTDYFCLK